MSSIDDIRLPPKWIELNITKRECGAFIATLVDDSVCQCGRKKIDHGDYVKNVHHQDTWNPAIHTRSFATDAFGTLIFEGEHHPNKAHFVRMSYDTNPDLVIQMMHLVWGLPMPKLLITIQGSNTNFELPPRLGKILQVGFIKAAKSCNAWIFTGGFNEGVTKHIGSALNYDRHSGLKRDGRVVGVGVAPWGLLEHREELLVKNKDKVYSSVDHARVLNPKHSNFLLVDNGSVGKIGGETYFRRRLEKCIARHSTGRNRSCDIPVVCVVIEGGLFTLRAIGDYLHEDPPCPVVIVAGSGRTADLVTWVLKKASQLAPNVDIGVFREEIFAAMIKMYHVNEVQCVVLFAELKRILAKKNLVTVFNIHANDEDFDTVILGSIFRSQHWSPLQQLSLTLVWDRVDIAESEVFVYGRDWSTENLEAAMMEALVFNRMDFVTLLLEHGLSMEHFLTVSRLESLYNTEHSSLLKHLVTELAKLKSRSSNKRGTLMSQNGNEINLSIHDVGVAISHIMGHIYKSNYIHMVSNAASSSSSVGLGYVGDNDRGMNLLFPFDDLFIWAILTKRQKMALLLWRHGHGALVKALVAVKMNKFIADHFIEKSDANFAIEFQNYAAEWENLSYEVVDSCFKLDQKLARQLLTMELERWSKMTNLQLAVMSKHRMLLGHPCSQILLADLWMGALNIKVHPTLKVLLGIFCPIFIFFLEFKSTEELKLLPHQEKPLYQTHTQSRIGGYNNPSDSSSLRTYVSNSKSSLLGNIFPRNKKKVPQEDAEEEPVNILHHDHHLHHSNVHEKVEGDVPKKKHKHVIIQATNVENAPSEPLSVLSIYKMPQNQKHRQRSSFVTTRQSLSVWQKFYKFQKAPITNFYRHAIGYLIFVVLLSYLILVPQDPERIGAIEIYVIAYLGALGLEVCRDFFAIDALNWSQKLVEFKNHTWQITDFIVITFFMIGVVLRHSYLFEYGMLIYRVSSIYWNLRLYKYMGVHRFLGPKLVMMSKMLKHMAYFAMIILVIVISFGIARESIRFPNTYPTWKNIAEAFLEPYVMMFGEVDTDALSPQCGEGESQEECPVGYWIVPIFWTVYMMVSNILIVNLLIAVFNGIYSEIDAMAVQIWMFQRFNFVMEFEEKPLLPPPAMILCHIYEVLIWIFRKIKLCLCEQELDTVLEEDDGPKIIMGTDHRLKTFLTPAEANIVFDFEENNVDLLNNKALLGIMSGSYDDGGGDLQSGYQRNDTFLNTENNKDHQIQQLKSNFRDICSELESHREKLDKLLSFWEVEMEQESQDNDSIGSTVL